MNMLQPEYVAAFNLHSYILTQGLFLNVDFTPPAPQIITVVSVLALTRDLSSGLHVTALTYLTVFKSVSMHQNNCFEKARWMFLRNLPWVPAQGRHKERILKKKRNRIRKESYSRECPLNVDWHVPVDVSQTFTLSSQLPLATCLPSGLKQTLETVL